MIETTSLELSKKLFATLTEAGVVPDAYLVWVKSLCSGIEKRVKRGTCSTADWCYIAPAFTACELGKRLPEDTAIIKTQEGWVVESAKSAFDFFGEHVVLAEAMGLMLLWLYENGHVSAEAGGKKEDS